jgi:hypothetical protein
VLAKAVEKNVRNSQDARVAMDGKVFHKPVRKIRRITPKQLAAELSTPPVPLEKSVKVGETVQRVQATSSKKVLIEEGRKFLEPKAGRKLSDFEVEESLNSLTGLLELLVKWDQEKKAGPEGD